MEYGVLEGSCDSSEEVLGYLDALAERALRQPSLVCRGSGQQRPVSHRSGVVVRERETQWETRGL